MSKPTQTPSALAILNAMADQRKAEKHPNVPYRVKSKYSDKAANDLTTCIVDYLTLCGHFATRLQSTGTYRDDIKKWVPSQQKAGLPDTVAIVDSYVLFCEVKIGNDRVSEVQKATIESLLLSGAYVFIAKDFQSFYDWFTALQPQLHRAESLPFQP
ncbi:VRR-NUC domain-containing protein [Spirosoma luteum]|uniref:VRR-NUC domain-containing protein n=1 Tax=Spirosoma luteum TaxID=431553 RepID=UPI0012F9F57D|nr:VRR-NUC domain-containing protein [Spirosoma luteum]